MRYSRANRAGMPPRAISHHLVRRSTPMTHARYRSLGGNWSLSMRQITNHTCRGGSLTLPVILEQNHIAVRQYHVISLREIRKCTAFSADTRGRVSLQHRMLQMMIDGAVEAPVGTPLPGCPVILEQNHIAAGDKMLFPVGKSRKCKHFRAGGSMPRPYWGKLFEIFKL